MISKIIGFIMSFIMSLFPAATGTESLNSLLPAEPGQLRVHFLDVGQGDSIFVELPNGKTMLIDGSTYEYEDKIINYIKDCGCENLSFVVATHPHSDHIGGLPAVIKYFDVDRVYMPDAVNNTKTFERLLDAVEDSGLTPIKAKAGVSVIDEGDLKIRFLGPVSDSYEELNDYSAVLKIEYRQNAFLFMGDSESLSENEIKEDVSSDVLKVGHHGSNSSSTRQFLKKVAPKMAVISVGEDNSYGHPSKKVIKRLEDIGAKVFRTDLNGDIVMTSDGEAIDVFCEKQ